jgi:hypothetical protein
MMELWHSFGKLTNFELEKKELVFLIILVSLLLKKMEKILYILVCKLFAFKKERKKCSY